METRGNVLIVNGEEWDFDPMEDGDVLEPELLGSPWWLFGAVEQIDGVIHIRMVLPHGPYAPETRRFPNGRNVTKDGVVSLPGKYDGDWPNAGNRLDAET